MGNAQLWRLLGCLVLLGAVLGCEASSGFDGGLPGVLVVAGGAATLDECPGGGVIILTGIDENENGVLEIGERDEEYVVCHGATGADGADGADGGVCASEDNGNGTFTITCPEGDPITVVNGVDGQDGKDGQDGADGKKGADGLAGADGADGAGGVSSVPVVVSNVRMFPPRVPKRVFGTGSNVRPEKPTPYLPET